MLDFSEPEDTDSLMSGLLKLITGGDTLSARPLFRNNYISFVPQFKPILLANKLPDMPPESAEGRELTRRVRVVDWNMEFYDERYPKYNPKNPKHKLALPGGGNAFERVLAEGSPYFMTYLLRVYYPQYKTSGLQEPSSILHRSEAYIRGNNPIHKWFQELRNESLLREVNDQQPVDPWNPYKLATTMSLWGNFSSWYFKNKNTMKGKPKREEVICYLEKRLGPCEEVDKHNHKMGFSKWEFNPFRESPSWNPVYQQTTIRKSPPQPQ